MREIDTNGAAALVRRESTCYLRREPRLANAAGPGQRQQPRAPGSQQVGRLRQFTLTPEQRCRRGGQFDPALGGARCCEALVLHEDRPLERLERGPGLDSYLLDQRPAHVAVLAERIRLAPGPVESQHQLRPSVLPPRLGCGAGPEPGDQLLVALGCAV